jgi:DNA-binding NarL/FixJ family response regulator
MPAALRPRICPILIGREQEVATIRDVLRGDQGGVLLLSGEAGIGKSRLVAEAVGEARRRGLTILQGVCFEQDRSRPYGPLLDLLRGWVAANGIKRLATAAAPFDAEIRRLLPEFAALLTKPEPSPRPESSAETPGAFEALAHIITRLADGPSLIVIEDLHWADDASLDLLLRLGRSTDLTPGLLLTFRSNELHPSLTHTLAELDRRRLSVEIPVSRLPVAGVDAMLRAMFGLRRPVRAGFLSAIATLTEGNPFFVEEVVRSLGAVAAAAADGTAELPELDQIRIPRTVEDAVQRRLAELSPNARRIADLAAVAGRQFDFALLRELAAIDESTLLTRIKELIAAQLVTEASADRFAFRHALTRQAIYSRLLERERRALHREIAERLAARQAATPNVSASELAYHYFAGESWPEAVRYAERAAEHALEVEAPTAALQQVNRALAALNYMALPPSPRLLRLRGQAHEISGEFDLARADLERALVLARAGADRFVEWQVLVSLGSLASGHDYHVAGHFLETAADLARTLPDTRAYAQTLNRLGNWYANTGRLDEAIRALQEALTLLRDLGQRHATAETLDLLAMSYGLWGDFEAATAAYDRAIDLFRALGDQRGLLSSLTGRVVWGYGGHFGETLQSPSRDLDAARRDAMETIELASRLEWPAMDAFARMASGANLVSFGAIGDGLDMLHQALRIATEIGHHQWIASTSCHLARTYLALLDGIRAADAAAEAVERARALGSVFWIEVCSAYLALAHLLNQHPDQAEECLRPLLATVTEPRSTSERLVAFAWSHLALSRGEPETALAGAGRLLAILPNVEPGSAQQAIPALLLLKGKALRALGHTDEAVTALSEAAHGAELRREPLLAWECQAALSQALRQRGDGPAAAVVEARARGTVASLAAAIDDETMSDHFRRATARRLPSSRPPTTRQVTRQAFGGLTERERDVAALVAGGLANREIAESLSIGHRTVETHVSSILAKLGLASRAQIAAWAIDHGLRVQIG